MTVSVGSFKVYFAAWSDGRCTPATYASRHGLFPHDTQSVNGWKISFGFIQVTWMIQEVNLVCAPPKNCVCWSYGLWVQGDFCQS